MTFLATATTGLKPGEDQLMLVELGDPEGQSETFVREVPVDLLQKSQEYHGLSVERMRDLMIPDNVFREGLAEALADRIVFTYNVPFQESFLGDWWEGKLWSLPLFVKGLETYKIPDESDVEDFKKLSDWCMKSYGRDPTFRSLVKQYELPEWSHVGTAAAWFVETLGALWTRVSAIPFVVQQRLL